MHHALRALVLSSEQAHKQHAVKQQQMKEGEADTTKPNSERQL